jgi:nickel/cobalt transporter (NicO) family protein
MEGIFALQRWLYLEIAGNLREVAGGDLGIFLAAAPVAVVFGAIHALMPGHGKTVLVSYHLGRPSSIGQGFSNGLILALTHVGTAIVLVMAGVSVLSRAFAAGGRTPAFETASAVMISVIGGFLLWRALLVHSRIYTHHHEGKALAFVTGLIPCPLTTFNLTYALMRGILWSGLMVIMAMTIGMVGTISGFAIAAVVARERCVIILAHTETWRRRVGMALEIGSSVAVVVLGAWQLLHNVAF